MGAIKLGNAPSVSHAVHKPHGAVHAAVSSQPHAAPQSVHGYGYGYEKPVTAVHAPAALPAPAYHAAAPVYHAAPVVHHAQYAYQYGVSDDYSGANFNAQENRDGYATTGSYSVALPDGRTQTVTYNVADSYSGYVADVQYSGEPHYAAAPAPVYA